MLSRLVNAPRGYSARKRFSASDNNNENHIVNNSGKGYASLQGGRLAQGPATDPNREETA
jgi:hypothetical protein